MKPTDDMLLEDILERSLTIPGIAKKHGMPLGALLRRLREPAFQELLAALQAITEIREKFHAAEHRAEAIVALRKVLADATDHDPRRKAAEAVLRAIRPAAARAPRPARAAPADAKGLEGVRRLLETRQGEAPARAQAA